MGLYIPDGTNVGMSLAVSMDDEDFDFKAALLFGFFPLLLLVLSGDKLG